MGLSGLSLSCSSGSDGVQQAEIPKSPTGGKTATSTGPGLGADCQEAVTWKTDDDAETLDDAVVIFWKMTSSSSANEWIHDIINNPTELIQGSDGADDCFWKKNLHGKPDFVSSCQREQGLVCFFGYLLQMCGHKMQLVVILQIGLNAL
ncbi:hypothetical protein A6R68_06919, partial [Neotoma lepida]